MKRAKWVLLCISIIFMAAALYININTHKISGRLFHGNVVKADIIWSVEKGTSDRNVVGRIVTQRKAARGKTAAGAEQVMLLRSHLTGYQVIADGKAVYDGSDGDGGSVQLIRIPVCSELQIEYNGVASSSVGTIKQSEAYVGDRLGMYMFLIQSNVYVFVFVIAALLFGIASIVVGLYMRSARVHERCEALLSLGIYILLAGLWIVTDSNLLVVFTRGTGLVELISFLAFYGLPIALLGFTEKMLPGNNRMFRVLQNIFIILLILYSVNYIWGLVPLIVMIGAEHIMMALTIILVLKCCIQSLRKHTDPKLIRVMLGYISFSACSICALIFFYLGKTRGYSFSYMIGILMFVFFLSDAACIAVYEQIRENANLEVYTKMAFQDMMTELGNRAAFLEEQKLVVDHKGSFAYIMIDANNLKKINDTLGHQKGDELLIQIAGCIRAGVGGRGKCYRIGGDEFVVSLTDVTEEEVRECVAAIREEVESADRQSDIKISAAMGYAWTAELNQNVEEVLEQADGAMYENKVAMKQRREDR